MSEKEPQPRPFFDHINELTKFSCSQFGDECEIDVFVKASNMWVTIAKFYPVMGLNAEDIAKGIAFLDSNRLNWEVMASTDIFHMEGELAETESGLSTIKNAANICNQANILYSLVLPPCQRTDCRSNIWETGAIDKADIVFGNRSEYEFFFGVESIEKLKSVSNEKKAILVVTCGKEGAKAFYNGNQYEVPALPARVNNPIGAGDNFSAGFLFSYFTERSILKALHEGAVLGALATTIPGSRLRRKMVHCGLSP